MKNTVFPHKFWRPFLDCMPQLFFRPQYVWFLVHLKGHLIPLCYETLVVNWQNWLFTLFHQSRSVLSPNPIQAITPMCSQETARKTQIWPVSFRQIGAKNKENQHTVTKIFPVLKMAWIQHHLKFQAKHVKFQVITPMCSRANAGKPKIWPVLLCQSDTQIKKINRQ